MEITLALVVLSILTGMGVWLFTWGVCNGNEDKMLMSGLLLVAVLLFSGIRCAYINDNKAVREAYELCVKKGKKFKKVLGTKVCIYE